MSCAGMILSESVRRRLWEKSIDAKCANQLAIARRIAADLHISDRVLYRCAAFARCFPILTGRSEFTWAHYRVLCEVPDPAQRRELARRAAREGWTADNLEQRVRALAASIAPLAELSAGTPPSGRVALLTPKRGTPGVGRVIDSGAGLVVDLGFATYLDLPASAGRARASSLAHAAGDFVRVTGDGVERAKAATKADLFTYAAEILKVVDGDTLWVKIYLRPRHWVKQKLRLRDLDCPEIATPEGKVAKRFTESLVPAGSAVTICTTKPDKYDRYLADVFVNVTSDKGRVASGEDVFVNNELLTNGHAVVKREWEFTDWGEV